MVAVAGGIDILEVVAKNYPRKHLRGAWRAKHKAVSLCMELGDLETPLGN